MSDPTCYYVVYRDSKPRRVAVALRLVDGFGIASMDLTGHWIMKGVKCICINVDEIRIWHTRYYFDVRCDACCPWSVRITVYDKSPF